MPVLLNENLFEGTNLGIFRKSGDLLLLSLVVNQISRSFSTPSKKWTLSPLLMTFMRLNFQENGQTTERPNSYDDNLDLPVATVSVCQLPNEIYGPVIIKPRL